MTKILLILLAAVPSWALLDVSLLVGISEVDQKVTFTNSSATTSEKSYYTVGALANLKVPATSYVLTSGVFYSQMGAHYEEVSSGVRSDYDLKAPYLQIPVILDYWLIEYIGAGLGIYYGTEGGNASKSGGASSSGSFSNMNLQPDDYGLALHGQVKFPLGPFMYATGNALYFYGLRNISTVSGGDVKNRGLLIHLGVGLGI